ncbi:Metal-dependent hydrolase, endonuclease/exonuclease/phosphatase family [Bifidobacterium bohemicum]|uniref:Endonuclease/exonuclease/phosphatase family protein n=1 Tax=Bifidobacterium bohemicum DSM 22767 TaxID=1437606 RepID=A0A086ZGT9_9BIFI|nr:endonuclease/exonuclease/phosphatase family protein [Bifidobacterium bohemicum]KFI45739.1 endonuclease/exonuclease/phosphatase family protein [Bifidobacterium bohemicum DSM 22767]SCC08337.1 Metal-dependent hydrolase, endonuclease/exonuclease/phosphatase family [Bifidobacterium bohemicum]
MGKGTAKSRKKNRGKKREKSRSQSGFLRVILGLLAWLCVVLALIGTLSRVLPEELQSLPYVPIVAAFTVWFVLVAVVGLLLSLASRRWFAALVALLSIALQCWWQAPYVTPSQSLPQSALEAEARPHSDKSDSYARVMTANVYKGRADPQSIVDLVRDERVEVLALQETTPGFIRALEAAGIDQYLPYSQVASSDGKYGNGLFAASPIDSPSDDDVDSSASFMPGGSIAFDGGRTSLRFVSVHTTSPKPGRWGRWRRSLDEVAMMRSKTDRRMVLMGDFNATTDHTAFRNILGTRFQDAAMASGHGFVWTWPDNIAYVPRVVGIDHVLVDQGLMVGQVRSVPLEGSDHAALLATIAVSET